MASGITKNNEWKKSLSVTFPFTAACDGICNVIVWPPSNNIMYCYICEGDLDGANDCACASTSNGATASLCFPIVKGETYSIRAGSNYSIPKAMVYPF